MFRKAVFSDRYSPEMQKVAVAMVVSCVVHKFDDHINTRVRFSKIIYGGRA